MTDNVYDNGTPLPADLAGDGTQPSDAELEEYLAALGTPAGDGGDQYEPSPEAVNVAAFIVTNDDLAEWALRKLAAYKAEAAAAMEQATAWRRRIDEWELSATRRPADAIDFFTGLLDRWLRARMDADPKVKSVTLPSGRVQSRRTAPYPTVVDAEAFCAWALDNMPAAVKLMPVASAMKAATQVSDQMVPVTPEGEVVPGVEVTPEQLNVSVVFK